MILDTCRFVFKARGIMRKWHRDFGALPAFPDIAVINCRNESQSQSHWACAGRRALYALLTNDSIASLASASPAPVSSR